MVFLCGRRIFLNRQAILSLSRRQQHGFIVLVPEIGDDLPEKNPLYNHDGLPEFNNITIENCRAAIAKQTLDFEAGVKAIEKSLQNEEEDKEDVFRKVFEPLEHLGVPLDTTWGLSKTLYLGNSTLMPTNSYVAIHERAKRARASKFNNKTIYNVAKAALQSGAFVNNDEQTRILSKFVLEGKLNGLELDVHSRTILAEHLNKMSKERQHFKQKTELSTKMFSHNLTDANLVRALPKNISNLMAEGLTGPWKITLQPHIYSAVMEYCPDREIRWNIWNAMMSRGATHLERELATSLHLEEIRYLRREIAEHLGYKNFAEMSMETKMAGSVDNVNSFLGELLSHARAAQDNEVNTLLDFARERGFKHDHLELWDVPYWRRKQVSTLHDFCPLKIKEYFPLQQVLSGLFGLCKRLFGITVKQRTGVSTWHNNVKFYDVFEAHSSAPVAGFYFDPFVRTSEERVRMESGGWMVGIQNHSRIAGQIPLAAMVFNFELPLNDRACHLTFSEVKALFTKFGHSLQHLLTRTNYSEVAGLSNVEWDAVEVCGHALGYWLYNYKMIEDISSHRESGDKLPKHLFECLINVDRHMAGFDLSRQLYLSALDLQMHTSKDFWMDIIKKLWPQYQSFPLNKYDAHPCSFTQIFSEEWGAAYYSHIWSQMIAADVFGAFYEVRDSEQRVLEVGKRFRETFLALGGSQNAGQIFRLFRGRDPSPKALITSLGI